MTKKDQKNQKKKADPPAPASKKTDPAPAPAKNSGINFSNDCIQIGNIKLSNIDLRSIVRKSEEISVDQKGDETKKALQNDPKFMKSLNDYANEKSKEIIDSTVFSEVIKKAPPKPAPSPNLTKSDVQKLINLTKPATSSVNVQVIKKEDTIKMGKEVPQPQKKVDPPPKPQTRPLTKKEKMKHRNKLVNPNGEDAPCFKKPEDMENMHFEPEDLDENLLVKRGTYPLLHESKLYLQQTLVIAENLLKSGFPFSFPFALDIYVGLTGIVRRVVHDFSGENSFKSFDYMFRHKYCESQNVQYFYMTHESHLMEIHNTQTLKEMLICHGAYPKGICNTLNVVGKVICIPRAYTTEELILEKEADLILGSSGRMEKQGAPLLRHLSFGLAPDRRYYTTYHQVIHYCEEEASNPYNQYDDVYQLVRFVQRQLDIEGLIADERNLELTEMELQLLLLIRFDTPYKNCTDVESMNLEIKSILEMLKKSRHQTKEAYHYIEIELKKNALKIKKDAEDRLAMLIAKT